MRFIKNKKYIKASILFYVIKNKEKNRALLNKSLRKKNLRIGIEKIYEDKVLILVNKPKNTIAYSKKKSFTDSFFKIISKKYVNLYFKIKIINRIDKETSGLILIAKNKITNMKLYKQMIKKQFKKIYIAVVHGKIQPINGEIKTRIRNTKKNLKDSKSAITSYKTVNIYNNKKLSLLEIELITGVTHQIRLHMKYKNTPILGDLKYFLKNKMIEEKEYKKIRYLNEHALQAYKISFIHPISLQFFQFTVPINFRLRQVISLYNIIN